MQKNLRLIVAGGREFSDYRLLADTLDSLLRAFPNEQVTIVSGTCSGADLMGERYAEEHGIPVERFPANWKAHGRAAGPIRNRAMAEFASKEHGVLAAFWNGTSRGTASMIKLAGRYSLETVVTKYGEKLN